MTKPTVSFDISIITPVKNGLKFLPDTLESIHSQKFDGNLEHIIVDGGSTDGSIHFIKDYVANYRGLHTLKFVEFKDTSMYDGIAEGFKHANGKILGYLNCDDIFYPGTLAAILYAFKEPHINWITGKTNLLHTSGYQVYGLLSYDYNRKLIRTGAHAKHLPFLQQDSTFWKRELLDLVDVSVFSSMKYAGDFYLWRCFAKKHQVYIWPATLTGFRTHPNQLSTLYKKEYFKELEQVREVSHNPFLWLKIWLYWCMTYLTSDGIKKKWGPHMIKIPR